MLPTVIKRNRTSVDQCTPNYTTAHHALITLEKFFARFFSRYKPPCSMEKCKRYESNIPQQAYKACPITAWVLLQNESERIRTFNILPPARSLSNTRFPRACLPFRHTLLNGISAVSNIFFVLCVALFRITVRKSGQFLTLHTDESVNDYTSLRKLMYQSFPVSITR